jgi:hypothetical protein
MGKHLIRSEEFKSHIDSINNWTVGPRERANVWEEPETYPCVLVEHRWDNPYGPIEVEIYVVELGDFE